MAEHPRVCVGGGGVRLGCIHLTTSREAQSVCCSLTQGTSLGSVSNQGCLHAPIQQEAKPNAKYSVTED